VHTLCTPPSFRLLSAHPLSFRLPSARCNTPICSVNGAFSLHSANGRKQKSRQKALKSRHSDDYRVQNKNAGIVSILTFLYGGEQSPFRMYNLKNTGESRVYGISSVQGRSNIKDRLQAAFYIMNKNHVFSKPETFNAN